MTGLDFWSPNVNIFRDPRWGRGQESYGEDPYLSGRFAIAFVKGIQGDDPVYFKAIATPKHYAVHSGPEALRHQFDAVVTDQDLYTTYLPQFEAAVTRGPRPFRHVGLQRAEWRARLLQQASADRHPAHPMGF